MINRRQIFSTGAKALAGGAAVLSFPHIARADVLAASEKRLSFFNTHTSEKTRSLFWADGQPIAEGLKEIDHILRDWRTGDVEVMDRDLLDLLHGLTAKVGRAEEELHIISGYRSPKTNNMLRSQSSGVAKKSLHQQGKAIDIRLPGTELPKLRNAAMAMKAGGVGYYESSQFIHVDTGRVRYW
jgi:uncharacterized protein YcbK (DUF882 family)|tara:strand:- start:48715 stop:49266 length:552 start_codon:yes stop_codon:yes gene_type:complete